MKCVTALSGYTAHWRRQAPNRRCLAARGSTLVLFHRPGHHRDHVSTPTTTTTNRMRATSSQSFQWRPPLDINAKYSLIVDLRVFFMGSTPNVVEMPLAALRLPSTERERRSPKASNHASSACYSPSKLTFGGGGSERNVCSEKMTRRYVR